MPSLPDTAVIILLGLLLFGPKGLAQIARQIGKLMGEFRRASNEFRMQMEEELRVAEQTDRQKEIAAVQAAAPATPLLPTAPGEERAGAKAQPSSPDTATVAEPAAISEPLPIATSGEISIMPPATGLPSARSSSLSSFVDAVPKVDPPGNLDSGPTPGYAGHAHPAEVRPKVSGLIDSEETGAAVAEESLHG